MDNRLHLQENSKCLDGLVTHKPQLPMNKDDHLQGLLLYVLFHRQLILPQVLLIRQLALVLVNMGTHPHL